MLIRQGGNPGAGLAFGLWRHRGEDGLVSQQRLRREWGEVFNTRGRKGRR